MKGRRPELLYAALTAGVFAALALLRPDLVAGAWRATLASLSAGGWPAFKVAGEILLFGGILALTFRTVPARPEPARDLPIVLAAALFGWAAEAWGTRTGLWTYYTGERPPLWIVPAWFIGALVIDRASRRAQGLLDRLPSDSWRENLWWAWQAAFWSVYLLFSAPGLANPAGIALTLLLAWALLLSRKPGDTALLLTGSACVFFADLWGTTNNCWRYHVGTSPLSVAFGISYGALFDSALVLAAVKAAGAAAGLAGRMQNGGAPRD